VDCVVADAVAIEPVSASEIPCEQGNLQGISQNEAIAAAFRGAIDEEIQSLAAKFPTQQSREFSRSDQPI
jgi:hypothetical protein